MTAEPRVRRRRRRGRASGGPVGGVVLSGAALLAPLLAACAGGETATRGAAVRDSAGVTIVENGAPREAWTVDALPSVDIGVLEGEPAYQLFRAVAGTRLSDGRIVVANSGTGELRFYDAEGRHLRTAGGKGEGPGEFQELMGLWRTAGDSLLAYDWRQLRVSVLGPEGAYVRSFRLETGEAVRFPSPLGPTAEGGLLARVGMVYTAGQVSTGVRRDSLAVLAYDMEGGLRDTVAAMAGPEVYVKASEGFMSVRTVPFGENSVVAAVGGHLVTGDTGRPELALRRPDGTVARLVRWAGPPRPVTDEDMAGYRDRQLAQLDQVDYPESAAAPLRAMIEEIPHGERFPAFGRILPGPAGDLWVQAGTAPGVDGRTWLAFDPEGHLEAEVEMPAGLTPWAVGSDWVLGRWEDELGVEHVRMHRLSRGAEGS